MLTLIPAYPLSPCHVLRLYSAVTSFACTLILAFQIASTGSILCRCSRDRPFLLLRLSNSSLREGLLRDRSQPLMYSAR